MPDSKSWPFRGGKITGKELTRKVADAVQELGLTSIAGVADWMGPEWSDPAERQKLGVVLNGLTRDGRPLERLEIWRGAFIPRESNDVLGVDRADRNDIRAKQAIRRLGGIVEYAEWYRATYPDAYQEAREDWHGGIAPSLVDRGTSDWQRMSKSVQRMVQSGQVCRDYSNNRFGNFTWDGGVNVTGSDGIYNLPKAELETCVRRGRWVARMMLFDDPRVKYFSQEDRDDLRDEALVETASAFKLARESAGMSIADVLADADVLASIEDDWDLRFERELLRREAHDFAYREAIAAGKEDDRDWIKRRKKELNDKWRERIYWRFEEFAGRNTNFPDSNFRSIGGHLTAPASFYRAVAAKLGVDAPALSRGEVIPAG